MKHNIFASLLFVGVLLVAVNSEENRMKIPYVESDCDDKKTCESCAASWSWNNYKHCRWCPETETCHIYGDFIYNKCSTAQNIGNASECGRKCPLPYTYDERIARKMYILSEAAYLDNPQQCVNNGLTKDAFNITDIVTFKCGDYSPDCTAIVAVSHQLKVIAVAFRGTTGGTQLTEESYKVLFRDRRPFESGGKIQSYFDDAFRGLRPCFTASVEHHWRRHPEYQLWVTGHSLGGSLASIAANYFSHKFDQTHGVGDDRIKMISFGAPRSGDGPYATAHDHFVPYSFRVVNKGDLAPHVPWCDKEMLSVTTYRCRSSSAGSFHHATEVWYPDGMAAGDTYRICRGANCNEDVGCSNSLRVAYNFWDHLLYFDAWHPSVKSAQCYGGVHNEYNTKGPQSSAPPQLSWTDKCQAFHY